MNPVPATVPASMQRVGEAFLPWKDPLEGNRMRKLGFIILCTASWLVGYNCGQQPDSPDIFGWISRQIRRFDTSAHHDSSDTSEPSRSETRSPNSPNGASSFTTPTLPEQKKMPPRDDWWKKALSGNARTEDRPRRWPTRSIKHRESHSLRPHSAGCRDNR